MALIRNSPISVLRAGARAWRLLRRCAGAPARGRYLILMYHDIGCGITADLFARQMNYLRTVAAVVPLDVLLEDARRGAASGAQCAITFDDGYEGVYRDALPCLLEHGFAATIYLSTGFIAESNNLAVNTGRSGLVKGRALLSWRQVREMDGCGLRFGSHTSGHGDLSMLGRREVMEQLRCSREEISMRLGKPCDHFAYPFGRFSRQAVGLVQEAGFRTAATTVHRALMAGDDPFRLPRAGIEDRYSMEDFKSIVRGDWDFIGLLQTLRRPRLRGATSTTPLPD
ncbi:MAG TPA: polysaccharide deacetylase family protein [Candidatus Binataceae bacterium]|nr:polysaccharide deacetylase family protein [Candidatus Binataceae bacterium]